MPKKMMIYERAVPITKERHLNWSVRVGDYGYARELNAVPLLTSEFTAAAREYPIIMTKSPDGYLPAALLGLNENKNLFVTPENRWHARYIPAFIRRYPFIFMRMSKNQPEKFVLCIDEAFSGCNTQGEGEALFDKSGKETAYLNQALKFSGGYQREFKLTHDFCSFLSALGILTPQKITYVLPDGKKNSINGLAAVKKDLLTKLPAKTLSELAQSGDLEMIYTHLLSMGNLQALGDRLEASKFS